MTRLLTRLNCRSRSMRDALRHHRLAVSGWFVARAWLPLVNTTLSVTLATTTVTASITTALTPSLAHAADMNALNHSASAASAATFASNTSAGMGMGTAVPAVGMGTIFQTITALAIMIGVLFGAAWLARRLGYKPTPRGRILKTIANTSLGGKERVAVIEIGETWLVLGVAPGNVRLLHTLPADFPDTPLPASDDTGSPTPDPLTSAYGQRFRDALKSEIGKRFTSRSGGDK
ncbi:flagellar biosynthetic protein FliO [Paraburkholderia bonniea]|uniref:flagellar biosynthetic protein FliO n=1 Tax=Paraburkholderia bonniea TaxID=2152891 RepID=UPI00257446B7|nr:flagellar biosynthetic protein FliO [Paraburkholderia bonniea]WJF90461.1 flagellar biosynthetic protein FliO [Paraburkholderia bonniea]WJF93776.1 flagellar biosynthetic protein FliO [Paraburkholderia bonniea]